MQDERDAGVWKRHNVGVVVRRGGQDGMVEIGRMYRALRLRRDERGEDIGG